MRTYALTIVINATNSGPGRLIDALSQIPEVEEVKIQFGEQ